MNVLVFAHDSSLYGASQSLLTALNGFSKEKIKLLVLLPYPGKIEDEFHKSGIEYKIVSYKSCVINKHEGITLFKRIKHIYEHYKNWSGIFPELKEVAYKFKPDVVYTNTSIIDAGFRLAKRLTIPHVWHIREIGENFIYLHGRKKITESVCKSEKSIFVSYFLRKNWMDADESKFHVVYNGIFDPAVYSNLGAEKFYKQKIIIGMLGAILPGKGQHIAINAFSRLLKKKPGCELKIYGDAVDYEYFQSLKSLTNQLQIEDKVFFENFLDEKHIIYRNIDLLLNCGILDSFGRTVIEAMGYGIPVIANSAGGIGEIIQDGINGLLFNGTPDHLAHAMEKLLSDYDLYSQISLKGFDHVKENFSISKYSESVEKILHEAANG